MDEKERELGELRDYGKKLLDEMQYKDIIAMVEETITHIADIAEEYSKEADNWRGRYEESAMENDNLSKKLTDLTEASGKQVKELRDIIGKQAEKIEGMGRDFEKKFEKKMEELYSHRNAEIDEYNKKAEGLIATKNALENIKKEVETEKTELEKDRKDYEKKERILNDRQRQIEINQKKIDGYKELYEYKLNAEQKIANAEKDAKTKIEAANETAKGWELKYGEEYELRVKLEEELKTLKSQLQCNVEDRRDGEDATKNAEVNSGYNREEENDYREM